MQLGTWEDVVSPWKSFIACCSVAGCWGRCPISGLGTSRLHCVQCRSQIAAPHWATCQNGKHPRMSLKWFMGLWRFSMWAPLHRFQECSATTCSWGWMHRRTTWGISRWQCCCRSCLKTQAMLRLIVVDAGIQTDPEWSSFQRCDLPSQPENLQESGDRAHLWEMFRSCGVVLFVLFVIICVFIARLCDIFLAETWPSRPQHQRAHALVVLVVFLQLF